MIIVIIIPHTILVISFTFFSLWLVILEIIFLLDFYSSSWGHMVSIKFSWNRYSSSGEQYFVKLTSWVQSCFIRTILSMSLADPVLSRTALLWDGIHTKTFVLFCRFYFIHVLSLCLCPWCTCFKIQVDVDFHGSLCCIHSFYIFVFYFLFVCISITKNGNLLIRHGFMFAW